MSEYYESILDNICEAAKYDDFETIIHTKNTQILTENHWNYLLQYSSIMGHLPLACYSVQNGADIHDDNDWVLKTAADEGYSSIVNYLLECEGGYSTENINIAFRMACENSHIVTVNYLVVHGANVRGKCDEALYMSSANGRLSIVQYLVEHGANIHELHDESFRTASEYGHLPVIRYLIECGADIHVKDDEAMRCALNKNNIKVIEFLVNQDHDYYSIYRPYVKWLAGKK